MAVARELLERVGGFEFDEQLVGGASIDAHGTPLTDEVLDACRSADAILLAAVGGPKWDSTDPDAPRPEQGLLRSEERRVGKECRSRWPPDQSNNNQPEAEKA